MFYNEENSPSKFWNNKRIIFRLKKFRNSIELRFVIFVDADKIWDTQCSVRIFYMVVKIRMPLF